MPGNFTFGLTLSASVLLHAGLGWWYYAPPREAKPPRISVQIGVASVESRAVKATAPKKREQPKSEAPIQNPNVKPTSNLQAIERLVAPRLAKQSKIPAPFEKLNPPKESAKVLPPKPLASESLQEPNEVKQQSSFIAKLPLPDPPPKSKINEVEPEPKREPSTSKEKVMDLADASSAASSASQASTGVKDNKLPIPLTSNVAPVYPPELNRARHAGKVFLQLNINERGTVDEIILLRSSGFAAMDAAAIYAIRRWRFEPGQRDGKPSAFAVSHQVEFFIPAHP